MRIASATATQRCGMTAASPAVRWLAATAVAAMVIGWAASAAAQDAPTPAADNAAELAQKLANPIGALISVPFQNNTDVGIGEHNGSRNTMNFQPIVPFRLNDDYSLITRYILPVITQHDTAGAGTQQSGLADTLVSAWISNAKVKNGVVWGLGSAVLIPTATDDVLATKKLSIGPTAIALKQTGGWTYGALVNQIWSVAGSEDTVDVDQMYLQPFVTYNWKSGTGLTVNTELTQSWEASTTTAFVNIMAGGLLRFGGQIVQVQVGPRIPVAAAAGSKADFGVRSAVIFVFPK
jgi:hypothetical protein